MEHRARHGIRGARMLHVLAGFVLGAAVVGVAWGWVTLAHPDAAPLAPAGVAASAAATSGAMPSACGTAAIQVSDTPGLQTAIADVRPGQSIVLAPGVYQGPFVLRQSGSEDAPIALCGPTSAILQGAGTTDGTAVVSLTDVSFWTLQGFTVRGGQKGVLLDQVQHSSVRGLTVTRIGDEGVHLQRQSNADRVEQNVIDRTGQAHPEDGQGVVVGTSKDLWCAVDQCRMDESNGDVVTGNRITRTTAPDVGVAEGTTGGTVSDNDLDGAGMSGLDAAWVVVAGNAWTITGNRGTNSPGNGFATHSAVTGWGTQNVFSDNTVQLGNAVGTAFSLQPILQNVVRCNNHVEGGTTTSNAACVG